MTFAEVLQSPARRAARQYRMEARRMRRLAAEYFVADPLEARRLQYWAALAEGAAASEMRGMSA